MRDTGNQAKYEQLLDDAGLEIRNDDDKERNNDENATLEQVRSQPRIGAPRRLGRTARESFHPLSCVSARTGKK